MRPWSDDIFGEVPSSFENRVRATLRDLEEPVMKHMEHKKAKRSVKSIVLVAVAAALLMTTALAAVAVKNFYDTAYGDKGLENSESYEIDNGEEVIPGHEWAEADPEAAEAIVGGYVQTYGRSVSAQGYTLTVEDVLIDENGMGAITYTISNPEGAPEMSLHLDDGSGKFTISDLISNPILTSDVVMVDTYDVIDLEFTTDTELHAVAYVETIKGLPEGAALYMHFNYRELTEDESGSYVAGESEKIAISTEERVPASRFVCGQGEIKLSPVSMVADVEGWSEGNYPTELVIRYVGGSEYVVFGSDPNVANIISGGISGYTGLVFEIFNRIVDVANVECITAVHMDGSELVFTPAE